MDFALPWPASTGEWMAWGAAAATTLFGLLFLFAPGLSLRLHGLQPAENHPEAVGAPRSTIAGFYLGVGLCCILLAQPFIYLALGVSWILTAFGRLISMLSDRGNTVRNWFWLVVELALGCLPLAYVLGFVA